MRLALLILLCLAPRLTAAQYLPDGAERWHFSSDGIVWNYAVEFGTAQVEGDTVVVLHGGFGAEHSYLIDPLLPFSDRYRFVLYDQRGSLRSPVAPGADSLITLGAMVEDLEALRRQIGVGKLTLLSHSMGAVTAYAYLDRYPERVRGLALTGPALPVWHESSYRPPDDRRLIPEADTAAAAERYRLYWEASEARTAAEMAEEGLSDLDTLSLADVVRSEPGVQKALFHRWQVRFAGANIHDVSRWRDLLGGWSFYNQRVADAVFADEVELQAWWDTFLPTLEAFSGPVAVAIGDDDFIDPQAVLWAAVVDRLPQAHLFVIEDAGHVFWVDQPGETTNVVASALRFATGSRE